MEANDGADRSSPRPRAIEQCVLSGRDDFSRPESLQAVLGEPAPDQPKHFPLSAIAVSCVQRRPSASNCRLASIQSESASPDNANRRRRSEIKYARRRISSSEGSPDVSVGSACGNAEIFVATGLRDFLTAVACRRLWRLSVFFVSPGVLDSAGS
jgi:hypothetical protein